MASRELQTDGLVPRADLLRVVKSPPAAGVLVALALLGAWTAYQVSLADALRFVGYELGFVLVPGVLVYLALTGVFELGLRQLAVGWALGYALELAAFVLTAATGTRSLFEWYPPLVLVAAGAAVLVQARGGARGRPVSLAPRRWPWALAALSLVVIAYVAELGFVPSPAPTLDSSVSYYQDQVWAMSLTAEARHHWPLQLPNLAGQPLHYHYFSYLDMAAVNQVTGIPIFDVVFRLAYPTMLLALALQFVYAGRTLGRSNAAGIAAAAIFFLVGSFDPFPHVPADLFPVLTLSVSFVFGMVFFVPLVVEGARFVGAAAPPGRSLRGWLVVAALALASAGAKASILPVVIVAVGLVGLVGVWALRARRELVPRLAVLGLTAGIGLGIGRLWIYPSESGGLSLAPLRIVEQEQPFALLISRDHGSQLAFVAIVAVGTVLSVLKFTETLLVGFVGAWLGRRDADAFHQLWLFALLVASLLFFYAYVQPGQSQAYFYLYGYAAGCILAGAGVVALWRRYVRPLRVPRVVFVTGAALAAALWAVDPPLAATPNPLWRWWSSPSSYYHDCCNLNMTPDLYRGLTWLKAHSSPNDVLVVNNQWQDAAKTDGRYFYYSAFSERRVLVEGEYGATTAPFPPASVIDTGAWDYQGRFALTLAIFDHGSRDALIQAERLYGVRYMVADKLHGATARQIANIERLGSVVYANPALVIVKAAPL